MLDGTLKAFFKHLILLSTIGVSTHYAMFVMLRTCTGQTFFPMPHQSYPAMQPTAGRRTVSLHFMKNRPLQATPAVTSGG
jgi:hypothetical protein